MSMFSPTRSQTSRLLANESLTLSRQVGARKGAVSGAAPLARKITYLRAKKSDKSDKSASSEVVAEEPAVVVEDSITVDAKEDGAGNAVETAEETANSKDETLKAAEESVKETVASVGETAEASVKETADALAEAAETVAKETEEVEEKTVKAAKETANVVVEETADVTEKVVEAVEETMEAAVDATAAVADSVAETTESGAKPTEIKEEIVEPAEPVAETPETPEETVETVEPVAKTPETPEETVESAEPVAETPETPEEPVETAEPVAETPEETVESAESVEYTYSGPEPQKFTIAEGQTGQILSAALNPTFRLFSGGFAKGYSAGLEKADKETYSVARAVGQQVNETSQVTEFMRPSQPLEIYEYEGCPFCKKVREAVSILDLDVIYYPCPRNGPTFRPKAIELGGKRSFPYMVDPGAGTAMYESDDIIDYLFEEYGDSEVPVGLRLGAFTTLSCGLSLIGRLGKGSTYREAKMPEKPIIFWAYEASPFCKVVREVLCELEIPHLMKTVARGSPKRQELFEIAGQFQVPYIQDPNTGVAMFESGAIIEYLNETYAA